MKLFSDVICSVKIKVLNTIMFMYTITVSMFGMGLR